MFQEEELDQPQVDDLRPGGIDGEVQAACLGMRTVFVRQVDGNGICTIVLIDMSLVAAAVVRFR